MFVIGRSFLCCVTVQYVNTTNWQLMSSTRQLQEAHMQSERAFPIFECIRMMSSCASSSNLWWKSSLDSALALLMLCTHSSLSSLELQVQHTTPTHCYLHSSHGKNPRTTPHSPGQQDIALLIRTEEKRAVGFFFGVLMGLVAFHECLAMCQWHFVGVTGVSQGVCPKYDFIVKEP